MAINFDEQNPAGDIYKSSGGYIPTVPASTWFGVPKEFFQEYFAQGIEGKVGGEYSPDYLFHNYGQSLSKNGKLVEPNEENTGLKVNTNKEPIFEVSSNGWGEVYANFGSEGSIAIAEGLDKPEQISPDKNPTTTAAKRALVNAIMSMYANEQFYLYMLSKGYVYKNVPQSTTEPPITWIESAKQHVNEEFDIPSFPVDQVEQLVVEDKPIINAFGKADTVPEGVYYKRDILKPSQHPLYGTKYDPSNQSVAITQEGYYNAIETDQAEFFYGYQPQNFPKQKAPWALEWSSVWSRDESISPNQDEFDGANLEAPIYEGKIKINADAFIESYLEPKGLVEFNAGEAINQYLNMINYRLIKLLEIHKQNTSNDFNIAISKIRPPVFWKDKPVLIKLLKKWDKQRVLDALQYLGKTEKKIKNNSTLNTLTMVKNSITNICANSWACF